jgi:polar amino acid transport system permease protein
MRYHWHFEVVWENLPMLLGGLWLTIVLAFGAMILGGAFGIPVALARLSSRRPLVLLAFCYTELFRTTPFLIQIVWVFYALPLATGLALSPFVSGLLAFGLNTTAYMAEIYRAGITSIPLGQSHAGRALGMTERDMMNRIILPQATRKMVPAIGTVWISLFKDTSLLSAIGVTELMFRARFLAVDTYRPVEILTVAALIYFVLTLPQSIAVNWLYEKMRTRD